MPSDQDLCPPERAMASLTARIRQEMTDLKPGAPSLCQDIPPSAYQIAGFKSPEWKLTRVSVSMSSRPP